jgi:hypothetical protein
MSLARQSHSKMERHSNIELSSSSSSIIKEIKIVRLNKLSRAEKKKEKKFHSNIFSRF